MLLLCVYVWDYNILTINLSVFLLSISADISKFKRQRELGTKTVRVFE